MNIFAHIVGSGAKKEGAPIVAAETPAAELGHSDDARAVEHRRVRRRTGRTEVYAVRVRGSFKGEILALQAELQLERRKSSGTARKVTEDAGPVVATHAAPSTSLSAFDNVSVTYK